MSNYSVVPTPNEDGDIDWVCSCGRPFTFFRQAILHLEKEHGNANHEVVYDESGLATGRAGKVVRGNLPRGHVEAGDECEESLGSQEEAV